MKTCDNCGTDISHKRDTARFCSDSCRVRHSQKKSLSKDVYFAPQTVPIRYPSSPPIPPAALMRPIARTILPTGMADVATTVVNQTSQMNDQHLMTTIATGILGCLITPKLVKTPSMADYCIGAVLGSALGATAYWLFVERNQQRQLQQQLQQELEQSQQGLSDVNRVPPKLIPASVAQYHYAPKIFYDSPIMGRLAPEANVGWTAFIHGKPGAGKSTVLALMIAELQRTGRVLFVLVEETLSGTVSQRLRDAGVTDACMILDTTDVRDIYVTLEHEQFDYVVIDSITELLPDITEQVRFAQYLKTKSLLGSIHVVQEVKSGGMSGSSRLGHAGDITLLIEQPKIIVEKNRFGKIGDSFEYFQSLAQNVHLLAKKVTLNAVN